MWLMKLFKKEEQKKEEIVSQETNESTKIFEELKKIEKKDDEEKKKFLDLFNKKITIQFKIKNKFIRKYLDKKEEEKKKKEEEMRRFREYLANNLNQQDLKLPWIKPWQRIFKANDKDKRFLFNMLIEYLDSWMKLEECFEIMKYKTKKKLLSAYYEWIRMQLLKGISIDIIMEDFPSLIKPQQLYLLRIWVETGSLSESLKAIRDDLEESIQNKRNIRQLTLYPKIVSSVAFSILIGFIMFWLPKIAEFTGWYENLPAIAQFSYKCYQFGINYYMFIIPWFFILFLIHKLYFSRTYFWIVHKDRFLLEIPRFNRLFKMIAIKTIFFYLYLLEKSWKNLIESFELIKKSMNNYHYYIYIYDLQNEVRTWQDLFNAFINLSNRDFWEKNIKKADNIYVLPEKALFDDLYVTYIQTWIKTGTLLNQYERLFKKLKQDIHYFILTMKSFVEFGSLLFVAPVVLFIMLNVYMSLFSVYDHIQ